MLLLCLEHGRAWLRDYPGDDINGSGKVGFAGVADHNLFSDFGL